MCREEWTVALIALVYSEPYIASVTYVMLLL